jgi:hypothetical protein
MNVLRDTPSLFALSAGFFCSVSAISKDLPANSGYGTSRSLMHALTVRLNRCHASDITSAAVHQYPAVDDANALPVKDCIPGRMG